MIASWLPLSTLWFNKQQEPQVPSTPMYIKYVFRNIHKGLEVQFNEEDIDKLNMINKDTILVKGIEFKFHKTLQYIGDYVC